MADPRLSLVRRFFQGTGSTYDSMVSLGTFGCDRSWKKKMLASVPPDARRVLDLACGTGIVTFKIARRFPDARVIGVDVTKEYLDVALGKARRFGIRNVEFVHSRAEKIEFDRPFDCVTASYLPKYADLEKLVRVLKRSLKPGGVVVMHDFTYPTHRWTARLWEFYFKILKTIGNRFYPEWRTVFDELPALLRKTTWVPDLVAALKKNGFTDIRVERLIVNAATIVTARNSI